MEVTCGIRAFDPHELLCHALAERQGYYADEQITVRLCDTTFTPDAKLPTRSYFQVACGAAALGRRAGYPWKVVFVSVDRPMFWVYGAPRSLAGIRIAGYPPGSPPDGFLRDALGSTEMVIVPSASDAMRASGSSVRVRLTPLFSRRLRIRRAICSLCCSSETPYAPQPRGSPCTRTP